MSTIENRFVVMCMMEDLVGSSSAETPRDTLDARARAIPHLPSLAHTMGKLWTSREVVPFLQACVADDDHAVGNAVADVLDGLVGPHLSVADLLPVATDLLASYHRGVRQRAVRATLALWARSAKDEALRPASAPTGEAQVADAFYRYTLDLVNSAWPNHQCSAALLLAAAVISPFTESSSLGSTSSDVVARRWTTKQLDAVDAAFSKALYKHGATSIGRWPTDAAGRTISEVICTSSLAEAAWRALDRVISNYAVPELQNASTKESPIALAATCGILPYVWIAATAAAASSGSGVSGFSDEARKKLDLAFSLFSGVIGVLTVEGRPHVRQPSPQLIEAALTSCCATASLIEVTLAEDTKYRHHRGRPSALEPALNGLQSRGILEGLLLVIRNVAQSPDWRKRISFTRQLGGVYVIARSHFALDALLRGRTAASDRLEEMCVALAESASALAADSEEEVRSSVAAALAEAVSAAIHATDSRFATAACRPLVDVCQQLVLDESAVAREHVVACITTLTSPAARNVLNGDADDFVRASVFPMLLDLLKDEIFTVRLAAVKSLAHCVSTAGRDTVEGDIVAAASGLLACPQWRVRETFAKAIPHMVQALCFTDTDALHSAEVSAGPVGSSHVKRGAAPSSSIAASRALFNEMDEEATNPDGGDEPVRRFLQANRLRDIIVQVLFDRVQQVRTALTASLVQIVDLYRCSTVDGCGVERVVEELWGKIKQHPAHGSHYLMRAAMLHAMGALGVNSAEARDVLERAQQDKVVNVRLTAAKLLAAGMGLGEDNLTQSSGQQSFSQSATSALPMQLSSDSVCRLRWSSSDKGSWVLQLIRQLLEDSDADVRQAATEAARRCVVL